MPGLCTCCRCHPTLSLLSNKHFYNSRLVDGVSAAQRAPLVPSLPPLVLCDCQGGSSQAAGGGSRSSINKAEANLVAQLVIRLLRGAHGSAAGPTAAAASGASAEPGAGTDAGAGPDAAGGSVMCEGVEGSDAAPLLEAHQLGVICFFRGQAGLIKQLIAAGGLWGVCRDVLHQHCVHAIPRLVVWLSTTSLLVYAAHAVSANPVCRLLLFEDAEQLVLPRYN